ncbi:hypothetical protein ACFLRM_05230 [Acidobacteriota bacterium]
MKKRQSLIVISAAILLDSSQVHFSQKVDVYNRPLQKERSREYDAIHYRVKIRIDEDRKAFWGENTITLSPLKDGFQMCSLDAETFIISSVESENSCPLDFQQTERKLKVYLPQSYNYGDSISFTVFYIAEDLEAAKGRAPGINFVDKSPCNPPLIIARSFAAGAHHWFPCYDFPNDKVTHEIIATVPYEYKALSNGKLVSITEDKEEGTKTFHWAQEQPNSTYLTTLVAGPFEVLEDSLGSLPVNYWVWDKDAENAKRSFYRTPEIIELFNKEYGYDYPWAKYDLITVPGGGGAECTSASV